MKLSKEPPRIQFVLTERHFLFGFAAVLFLFYPDLFLALTASLSGDHWQQHYPWARHLFLGLHKGELPFWTSQIHCGFPLVAESQIALFYLPNILLSLLLPLRRAYAYQNVFHFLIGGAATYYYARQIKLGTWGSFVAGVLFLFSAAGGGAYYNITSLKTLAWFPLQLFFFEKYWEGGKRRYLFALAFCLSLSLLAGYLQVALFTLFIWGLYVLVRIFTIRGTRQDVLKKAAAVVLSVMGGFLISSPQLLLTYDLALLSNRAHLQESYAYVGSMSPLALITLVFPMFQGAIRGNCLYMGIFPIFLMVCAFLRGINRSRYLKLWVIMALLSFFLALGEWSPLYVGFIKITKFYAFRFPSKFLVFICFSLAILAGMGFDILNSQKLKEESFKGAVLIFSWVAAVFWLGFGLLYFFVHPARSLAVQMGHWFADHFIVGRMGHPHPFEHYYERIQGTLNIFQIAVSPQYPWNPWILSLFILSFILLFMFQRKKQWRKMILSSALVLLLVDLFVYAWGDLRLDIVKYDDMPTPSPAVRRLIEEKEKGRVGRIYGVRDEKGNLDFLPNSGMLYDLEDIGAYTPFVLSRYYETIGQFGNIDDSNKAFTPPASFIEERIPLLSALGVSHILSRLALKHPSLSPVFEDLSLGTRLYENKAKSGPVYFVTEVKEFLDWEDLKGELLRPGFDPAKTILLEKNETKKLETHPLSTPQKWVAGITRIKHTAPLEIWELENETPGFFVLMNTYYPGWTASVNGEPATILKAYGLFQTVWIPKAGRHEIKFSFHPFKR